jgi:hypothetical protein
MNPKSSLVLRQIHEVTFRGGIPITGRLAAVLLNVSRKRVSELMHKKGKLPRHWIDRKWYTELGAVLERRALRPRAGRAFGSAKQESSYV